MASVLQCDCERILSPLNPGDPLPDHVCDQTARRSVLEYHRKNLRFANGSPWPLPVSMQSLHEYNQRVHKNRYKRDSEFNLKTPQLGDIDWLALVVEIVGSGWRVDLRGSAKVITGPERYLLAQDWHPEQPLRIVQPPDYDNPVYGSIYICDPTNGRDLIFDTGPVSMGWQYDLARSSIEAPITRPRRVGDESQRLERWYAGTILGRPVGDGRGRKPRENDQYDNWIEQTEKAITIKQRYPKLPWRIIAEAHLNVSVETLYRWRSSYAKIHKTESS